MRNHAFTLLEILVVMAIIVILISLFAPAVYQFIKFVRHLGQ